MPAGRHRAHRPRPARDSRAAAVGFFALLPIAVAIGVVVGRSGNDGGENEALLEALRNQPAAVASTTAGATTAATNSGKASKGKASQEVQQRRRQGRRQDQQRRGPPGDRLQAAGEEGRRRHAPGRSKPRTDRRKLHQGPAEPARRDRRRRRPRRGSGRRRVEQRNREWAQRGTATAGDGPEVRPGEAAAAAVGAAATAGKSGGEARGERRAARPARPPAGEVHGHAGRPRRRLLRDGDPRPRADGRADPQGGGAAAGRRRAAGGRADARAAALRRRRPLSQLRFSLRARRSFLPPVRPLAVRRSAP